MKKPVLITAAFVGLGILFVWMAGGFVSKLPTELQAQQGEAMNGRELIAVRLQPLPQWQSYAGMLVAEQQTTLSARLVPQVADVLVNVGDRVQVGDVLIRLDNQDLDARVRQSEQGLASRQAHLNQARKDYQRILSLQESKAVSKAQLDQAFSELQSAEAGFKQAQASLVEAKTTKGFSLITAPFDGVITRKLLNKGDTASLGVAMLSLYNPKSLVVESQVAAGFRNLLKVGQIWPVDLPELKTQLRGTITEITPAAEIGTRTVTVRLAFEPDQAISLYSGLFARFNLQVGEEDVIDP